MDLPLAMTERTDALEDQRDPVLFAALLRENRSRVFGYLLALVQNLSDAEDLYQQTALVLWEKFSQYEPGYRFWHLGDRASPTLTPSISCVVNRGGACSSTTRSWRDLSKRRQRFATERFPLVPRH